jgi:serine protease Do
VTVILQDGRRLPAKILGRAPHRDLAVLRIKTEKPLPAARFGKVAQLKVGQYAVALGNPFGLARDPEPTMTVGHISALGRTIPAPEGGFEVTNVIQTDAAINPGNSGGPLANIDGEVIGINTAIFTTSGGSIGIGFAVPLDQETLALIDQLKRGTAPEVGWIGVTRCQIVTPALAKFYGVKPRSGLVIVEVAPRGPAQKAGIQSGDLLLAIDGKTPATPAQLADIVSKAKIGRQLEAVVLHKEERLELRIEVTRRSFSPAETLSGPRAWRGIEVADMGRAEKTERGLAADAPGVRIAKVQPGGAAAHAGIKPGDVIVRINRRDVADAEAFLNITRALPGRTDVLVKLQDRIVVLPGLTK